MKNAAINNPPPTREEVAKAMSRKPVKGCSKGPWFLVDSEHGWQLWAAHGRTGSMMIAQFPAAGFDELNAGLAAISPDLQDETQVLQVTVRQLELAAIAFRDLNMCYRIDKRPTEALFRRLDKAKAALALMPTERESDDTK